MTRWLGMPGGAFWVCAAGIACLPLSIASEGTGKDEMMRLTPGVISADEGCQWRLQTDERLRIDEAYIAGPQAGQDRGEWLAAVKEFRNAVREGKEQRIVALNFDGVRAWTRLTLPLTEAMDLARGDTVQVTVEARRIEGNSELCAAFDYCTPESGAWAGWSSVQATLPLPQDGTWHQVTARVRVPADAPCGRLIRPILGMDATHSTERGKVEIRRIGFSVEDPVRMERVAETVRKLGVPGIDSSNYDRPDLAWVRGLFTCHFTFLYDESIYDPGRGYRVKSFLDEGVREFGGYDAVVLWHAYPRIGIDERNQFDCYRDMPGGIEGLRGVVQQFHAHGVKVFIDYNPWDTGTRREGKPDEEALAETVAALDADGIFLDTMRESPARLREAVDRVRKGVAFAPEGQPPLEQLGVCNASWAQWMIEKEPPGMPILKWVEPRHVQHQIRRWNTSHGEEIEIAFFNGSGMLVWENVFGTYNPWPLEDRATWRKASAILHHYAENFASEAWDPFYPTAAPKLAAHRWPGEKATVFTLRNLGSPLRDTLLFETPISDSPESARVYDLWNGGQARCERKGSTLRVFGSVDRLGAIAIGNAGAAAVDVCPSGAAPSPQGPAPARSVAQAKPAPVTEGARREHPPARMVYVPEGRASMRLTHMRRECGCYPDPGTPPDRERDFLWGAPFDGTLTHDYEVEVRGFFMDETEVSNAEFDRFLKASRYQPAHTENFLKHRADEKLNGPDQPVVYVDLEDARAYARWAGKRLPTEPEWQWAAQGTDGRAWPWGNTFDPARVNALAEGTVPVRSLPEGRSPYGAYHMAGNVWEWTESERDDGHTRFAMLRGGSYFAAQGSIWYTPGGAQPCTSHTKFILMGPGLDRCATIGFRCVKDVAP